MFMNMKGGVGKTTLAVELSNALSRFYAKNVLLIDYDPQANASLAFLGASNYFERVEQGKSLASCLMPDLNATDPFNVVGTIRPTAVDCNTYAVTVRRWVFTDNRRSRLDLIPGNLELMRLALNVLGNDNESRLFARWNGLIDSAKSCYDCIVIDCHPAGSFFTKSALLASTAVIVPVTSDAYAATGLSMMRQHMEMWQSAGGAKEFFVIFNDAHRSWDSSVELTIRGDNRFSSHCLANIIGYSTLLRNQAKRHQTALEQRVPHRFRVGGNVLAVTREMVGLLKGKAIMDSSWR